jgi:hypothetical protein
MQQPRYVLALSPNQPTGGRWISIGPFDISRNWLIGAVGVSVITVVSFITRRRMPKSSC